MTKLHKYHSENHIEPTEGQRDILCSNKESLRCPSLGLNDERLVDEDKLLDYLAEILTDTFLDKKINAKLRTQKECSHILPSID